MTARGIMTGMPLRTRGRRLSAFRSLGTSTPLLKAESVTLLALVSIGVAVGLLFVILSAPDDVASSVFQLVLTAVFALFAWSPMAAVAGLLGSMVLSFTVDNESSALVALAVAVGCVIRTATRSLIVLFIGGFLLSGAAVATYAVPTNFAAALLVAAVSGSVGLLLTAESAREKRLQERLQAQEKAEREATFAERQRIADELHDVIAHDLTVIAMYARVLERPIDAELREQSQQTIRDAAHKALGDLRRVVEQARGPEVLIEAPREGLVEALDSVRAELKGVGDDLIVDGDLADECVPRLLDGALARIVRESVTNVLKHGGHGTVEVALRVTTDTVVMSVRSPLASRARRDDLPSGRYGIMRMAARARQLGGELNAGASGDTWAVEVRLPLS